MAESYIKLGKEREKNEFCRQFFEYHWMEGMSIGEIAKKLGKHYTTIYNKARFHNLPIRSPKEAIHHYNLYKKPPNMKKLMTKIKQKGIGRKNANEMWKEIREAKKFYEEHFPNK